MSANLEKRLERLESESGFGVSSMCIHWQLPDTAQQVQCDGTTYAREEGESLGDFIDRAVTTALATASTTVLWIEEKQTI